MKWIKLFLVALSSLVMACQPVSMRGRAESDSKTPPAIYVQAARGSFNHQAVSSLYQGDNGSEVEFMFSGTPLNTFENAWRNKAEAFVALRNDLVPGHLIPATVNALKEYKVNKVTAGVSLPVEMCLLRTKVAVEQALPLKVITSHPAALAQIALWKAGKRLEEQYEPDGTSVAAKRLAEGELSVQTGVVGAGMLADMYPALVVVESGIQDAADNRTLFGRLWVEKREQPVSEAQARSDLQDIVQTVSSSVLYIKKRN